MNPSSITTGTNAPYPSSRPDRSSQREPSGSSSSVPSMTSRPMQPSPLVSASTRPPIYAELYSREYSYRDGVGSQFHRQTQPLAYPYNTFASDVRSMGHSINMPDHNEYVEPSMARGRREHAFLHSPPYPPHGHGANGHWMNAMQDTHSGSIRQPTAEDFLRSNHPLPAPPTEVHDSDQDLLIIEPDSYLPGGFNSAHADVETQQPAVAVPKRHHTTAAGKSPSNTSETKQKYKRSRSALITSSRAPTLLAKPTVSEHDSTPGRVPAISDDMYQPALGGLQRVSDVHRRESLCDRMKRFMSGLNPFRRQRKFGRQQG